MSFYDPAEEVLESLGTRFRLERTKYGHYIRRYSSGGSMGSPVGKDAQKAREAWTELLAKPRCRVCGDPQFGSWMERAQKELDERQLCFWCNHWTNNVAEKDADDVVIDGRIYSIGETEQSIASRCGWPMSNGRLRGDYQHVLGHGGAEFTIEFFDGRAVTTTNLWAGGEIPGEFRAEFPDNARFVKREHSHAYVGSGSASCPELEQGMDVSQKAGERA